jgi:hypothetical protein
LYLLCRIYRVGKLTQEKKKKKEDADAYPVKRPMGAALLELTATMVGTLAQGASIEGNLQIYGCKDESTFYKFPQSLLTFF